MEPILENIELPPQPSPTTVPRWNPANAPVPVEFYDNSPSTDSGLNSSFAEYAIDSSFDLDFSDPEFVSFEDDSTSVTDTSSVISVPSSPVGRDNGITPTDGITPIDRSITPIDKIMAKSKKNNHKKKKKLDVQIKLPKIKPGKRTETYQYHLVTPIFKDRHYFVSKDNPKFKEMQGKSEEFASCRYKYYCVCVGRHVWKRIRNQAVRTARSGARRQNEVKVHDRHLSVKTFYYSLTFHLETMPPLKLRGFSDMIKALKIPVPSSPTLFTVTYSAMQPNEPVAFTVISQSLSEPNTQSDLPSLPYGKDYVKDFNTSDNMESFVLDGQFMDNLQELSQLDGAPFKRGPVLVSKIPSTQASSLLGNISPIDYNESSIILTDLDSTFSHGQVMGFKQEQAFQVTPALTQGETHSAEFSTSIGGSSDCVVPPPPPKRSSASMGKTMIKYGSPPPPPPPKRGVSSLTKMSENYTPPFPLNLDEIIKETPALPAPDPSLTQEWTSTTDPTLMAEFKALTEATIIENPYVNIEQPQHHASGHSETKSAPNDLEPSGDRDLLGTDTLDSLITELLQLSEPKPAWQSHDSESKSHDQSNQHENKSHDNKSHDKSHDAESRSVDTHDKTVTKDTSKTTDGKSFDAESAFADLSPELRRAERRRQNSTSPARLPENFVADMDSMLRRQIFDLEKSGSVSPAPGASTAKFSKTSPSRDLSMSPAKTRSSSLELKKSRSPSLDLNKSPVKNTSTEGQRSRSSESPASETKPSLSDNEGICDRSQSYDTDALGGTEGLESAHLRHSPITSPVTSPATSPFSSPFNSLSRSEFNKINAVPQEKKMLFRDELDAFDYFKIKHFDAPYVEPVVTKTPVVTRAQPLVAKMETNQPSPRETEELLKLVQECEAEQKQSQKKPHIMFQDETQALDYFKIKHFSDDRRNVNPEWAEYSRIPDNSDTRWLDDYLKQLNSYTPRPQPVPPKRVDSTMKFQEKLHELQRLSAACGQVADQIQRDNQDYWGSVVKNFPMPVSRGDRSVVTEAYDNLPSSQGSKMVMAAGPINPNVVVRRSEIKEIKLEQMNPVYSDRMSAAVSENIMNLSAEAAMTPGQGQRSPVSSPPRTVKSEVKVNMASLNKTPPFPIPQDEQVQDEGHFPGQGHLQGQGHILSQGFWSTSPADIPHLKSSKHKRSVTWSDDLTSTDDDRMSDSSASVVMETRNTGSPNPNRSAVKKAISPGQKRKVKKKVSWSDECNTDDERASSSSLSSSVMEGYHGNGSALEQTYTYPAESQAIEAHGYHGNGSPLQQTYTYPAENQAMGSPAVEPRVTPNGQSISGPPIPQACPIYEEPIFASGNGSGSVGDYDYIDSYQGNNGSHGNVAYHGNGRISPGQQSPPGSAKRSLGVQRYKTDYVTPSIDHVTRLRGINSGPITGPNSGRNITRTQLNRGVIDPRFPTDTDRLQYKYNK